MIVTGQQVKEAAQKTGLKWVDPRPDCPQWPGTEPCVSPRCDCQHIAPAASVTTEHEPRR